MSAMQAKPGKARQGKKSGGGGSKNFTFNSCPANANFESSKESREFKIEERGSREARPEVRITI